VSLLSINIFLIVGQFSPDPSPSFHSIAVESEAILMPRVYYCLERCRLEVMSLVYHEDSEPPICLIPKALIVAYCFTCSIKEPIPTFFL